MACLGTHGCYASSREFVLHSPPFWVQLAADGRARILLFDDTVHTLPGTSARTSQEHDCLRLTAETHARSRAHQSRPRVICTLRSLFSAKCLLTPCVCFHRLRWTIHPRHGRRSIVVSIPACHAGDPGSIPGDGGDVPASPRRNMADRTPFPF